MVFCHCRSDEATDVASNEQMSVAIRWVSDSYDIQEDPVGFFKVPNMAAENLFTIIKKSSFDVTFFLSLCKGRTYDGASNT